MVSPLQKVKEKPSQNMAQTMMPIVKSSSPLARQQNTAMVMPQTLVTDEDIEALGSNVSQDISNTINKIIGKMMLDKFGALGDVLAQVRVEVEKLQPEPEGFDVLRWIKKKMTDAHKLLVQHFESAVKAFDVLATHMSDQITVHTEWIKDLDVIYGENYQQYQALVEVLKKGSAYYSALNQQISNWPEIAPDDPDGMMKMQAKQDALARLNRLQIKLDFLNRWKAVVEDNGPLIRNQQETSRKVIQALRDQLQALPIIKVRFAMHLQSMDALKSVGTVENNRTMVNQSLQQSSLVAKDAALATSKSLNSAAISNDTLAQMRTSMLETLTGIERINNEAQAQRVQDAQEMSQRQAQYLTALQAKGAV